MFINYFIIEMLIYELKSTWIFHLIIKEGDHFIKLNTSHIPNNQNYIEIHICPGTNGNSEMVDYFA